MRRTQISFSGCNGPDVRFSGGPLDGSLMQRKIRPDFVTAQYGLRDKSLANPNRSRQIVPKRERGANGGGIRAARSVRADALHKGRGQKQLRFAIEENVGSFAGIFQVAALDKNRAAEARTDFPRGSAHFWDRGDAFAG